MIEFDRVKWKHTPAIHKNESALGLTQFSLRRSRGHRQHIFSWGGQFCSRNSKRETKTASALKTGPAHKGIISLYTVVLSDLLNSWVLDPLTRERTPLLLLHLKRGLKSCSVCVAFALKWTGCHCRPRAFIIPPRARSLVAFYIFLVSAPFSSSLSWQRDTPKADAWRGYYFLPFRITSFLCVFGNVSSENEMKSPAEDQRALAWRKKNAINSN